LSATADVKNIQDGIVTGSALLKKDQPDLSLEDTGESSPAGKFKIYTNSDLLYIAGRNTADTGYENIIRIDRLSDAGRVTAYGIADLYLPNTGIQIGGTLKFSTNTWIRSPGEGTIETYDDFNVMNDLFVGNTIYVGNTDTNLYRSLANVLKTDDNLHINEKVIIGSNQHELYDAGAEELKLLDGMFTTSTLKTDTITFGVDFADTGLYRYGINTLKTDDCFVVGENFIIEDDNPGINIQDTDMSTPEGLFRVGVEGDQFIIYGATSPTAFVPIVTIDRSGGTVFFSGDKVRIDNTLTFDTDVTLYKSGSNTLKTGHDFDIDRELFVGDTIHTDNIVSNNGTITFGDDVGMNTFDFHGDYPLIQLTDIGATPPEGKFALYSNADYLYIVGRNTADTGWQTIVQFERPADGGRVNITGADGLRISNKCTIAAGTIDIGDGVNLYRSGPDTLKTDDDFVCNTIYFEDMVFNNKWRMTEHPEHGIVLVSPSNNTFRFNLEAI